MHSYVQNRVASIRPYTWGFVDYQIDEPLLAMGKVAIAAARGIFPDGTPFVLPQDEQLPAPVDIPEGVTDTLVYLALPIQRQYMDEAIATERSDSLARYRYSELEVRDSNAGFDAPASLHVAKMRMRLVVKEHDLGAYTLLGVARIKERRSDSRVVLDKTYIPPCLDCHASSPLRTFMEEVQGLLHHRGEAVAERLSQPNKGGVSEVAQFLMLQAINRFEPWFAHLINLKDVHPVDFYAALVQLAGEMATFTHPSHRTDTFPLYQHDDLQLSFEPVIQDLRQSLSLVLEQNATPIPLEERKYGVRVAVIDPALLRDGVFVLAVQARMPPEALRLRFPAQVKMGPVERIRDLVNLALPGIALYPLPVAPRHIPYHAGYTYFELDRSGEYWQQLQESGGFALHIAGEFPDLELEFWAIRN